MIFRPSSRPLKMFNSRNSVFYFSVFLNGFISLSALLIGYFSVSQLSIIDSKCSSAQCCEFPFMYESTAVLNLLLLFFFYNVL